MRHIDPDTIHHSEAHRYLLACVAPRPIAFVGTMDADGRPNLAPFSFFNAFGTNPPVVAFSPAYRGVDGRPKHTFLNVKATGEFTISVVSYSMVEQMSLASSDYDEGVDEFVKGGFTPLPSTKIKPFGVAESPMVMECKLLHHIDFGGKPGSGNIMIGEVIMFHIKESAFEGKYPSPDRLDLVARMGGPFYCRASGSAVFELPKPSHVGIGFDQLPKELLESSILTGNDLAKLAGVASLPDREAVAAQLREQIASLDPSSVDDVEVEIRVGDPDRAMTAAMARLKEGDASPELFHRVAQLYLRKHRVDEAWRAVLAPMVLSGERVDR